MLSDMKSPADPKFMEAFGMCFFSPRYLTDYFDNKDEFWNLLVHSTIRKNHHALASDRISLSKRAFAG